MDVYAAETNVLSNFQGVKFILSVNRGLENFDSSFRATYCISKIVILGTKSLAKASRKLRESRAKARHLLAMCWPIFWHTYLLCLPVLLRLLVEKPVENQDHPFYIDKVYIDKVSH